MNLRTFSLSALVKLASLVIHYQELNSEKGHAFDKRAIDTLENDPEVKNLLDEMNFLGLLPVKR